MGMFDGKKGLVFGIANDHSIAWAITQKLHAEGAEMGFTHLPDKDPERPRMERRLRKLVEPLGAKLILPCDVQRDEDLDRIFTATREQFGTGRFRPAFDRLRADRRPAGPDLQREPRRLQDGDGNQRLQPADDRPPRPRNPQAGRQPAHVDVSGRREGDSRLQHHGNLQGGARKLGRIPGQRTWAQPASASTRSVPVRSRRSARRPSANSIRCSSSTRRFRPCGATSRPRKSPTPACIC